jgi:glycosyltransferase involved in cell wall biosynthesis
LRFGFFTTFFGRDSFGGDAVYVERLSAALLRAGHEVDVIHCRDSFDAVRGGTPRRSYEPPSNLRVHTLSSTLGLLNPLWSHQTGGLGLRARSIREIARERRFDVVHLHNVSLLGGTGLLAAEFSGDPLRLMSVHEHWLVCPLSHLWKFDREVCETRECVRCTFRARRPPQLWRETRRLEESLVHLDALLFPSQHTLELHRASRIEARRMVRLPYFLPTDWHSGGAIERGRSANEPYLAAAGRLVKEKGFQDLIRVISRFPSLRLRIAGAGPYEGELRSLAAGSPQIEFLGMVSFDEMARLFAGARAVVVPSLFYETFGYVAAEAMSVGTPVIARARGALTELIRESGGGICFATDDELAGAIGLLLENRELRDELGERGRDATRTLWSEQTHLAGYLSLIEELRASRCDRGFIPHRSERNERREIAVKN